MSISRLACLLALAVAACDAREPDADAEPPREQPRAVPSAAPAKPASTAASTRIEPTAFDARVEGIRDGGDVVEIEIALGRPLPPTNASRPALHVGDEVVHKSRHPQGRLDRLVFLVAREQFDRMPDGAAIELHGLALTRGPIAVAPALDKATVTAP
ncbi:MAG TPA: hypothetical protein VFG69_12045 [Nannocystaceae bacterium]|nr:hypothetical protein [Nannocystaceae bacterium]